MSDAVYTEADVRWALQERVLQDDVEYVLAALRERRPDLCVTCGGHGEWGYSPESLHTCESCAGTGEASPDAVEES